MKNNIKKDIEELAFVSIDMSEIKTNILLYHEVEALKKENIDLMMDTPALMQVPKSLVPKYACLLIENFTKKENDQEVYSEIKNISKSNLEKVKIRNKQIVKRKDERRKQ